MIVNTTCIISMHLLVSMILTYSMCIEFGYKEMKQKCGPTKIVHYFKLNKTKVYLHTIHFTK